MYAHTEIVCRTSSRSLELTYRRFRLSLLPIEYRPSLKGNYFEGKKLELLQWREEAGRPHLQPLCKKSRCLFSFLPCVRWMDGWNCWKKRSGHFCFKPR